MYEYLKRILRSHFDYCPKEPYKLFEELSRKHEENLLIDNQVESSPVAQRQLILLSNQSNIEGNMKEIMSNLLEVNNLFEQIGISLNKEEIYWIWLLMKDLLNEKANIEKLRFWGKIFGLENNYYIVEADFNSCDDFDLNDSEFLKYQEACTTEEELDDSNINLYRQVPPELIGEGVNRKIFFVTTGIDKPFIQLPMVTPEQIRLSRKIQQFFTGNLEASVLSDSNFPGVEKHLLRAQIQRISACTQIAPKNYFKIPDIEDEDMGEETMDLNSTNLDINDTYEGNKLEDLALSNGQYWVHYVPYIYEQGRNIYFYQEEEKSSIERGPHLLTSINEDIAINELYPAWSIDITSTLVPEHTLVYVRSNRWPGLC
ncbi:unnamed protein product [Adineta steineri]|uniref:Uncharacterized protein n=1 Tax=Adineta steineri TaxID=433720 RepID=A0A815UX09_9BILA|nr:unnamed protein product [Adineta steineri]CAF4227699.1 unnamed protein product [Adineta steineri]